mmetsp:Transcript_25641/g.41574  ORF Transcript_25641/g.41574 Transcript_25641/m.41574 type:complete len:200 (-) Transcript_25641:644-1243(-)
MPEGIVGHVDVVGVLRQGLEPIGSSQTFLEMRLTPWGRNLQTALGSTGKMVTFERDASNFFSFLLLRSHDGIPTCLQVIFWNLAFREDVTTLETEILVKVKGRDDPSGVAFGPIQAITNHPVEMPTAHIQGLISWILRHIEVDPCGQASFQVRHQDFLDSILSSLEGVDTKVVDPMQKRKFEPLHHLFYSPSVIFGCGT